LSLFVDVGIVAMMGLSGKLWEKKDYQIPYMIVEARGESGLFVGQHTESRTAMKRGNQFNPQTAMWKVYGGWRGECGGRIELGHVSEHRVDAKDELVESFDYIKLSWQGEF
jgi:hypothetical protein